MILIPKTNGIALRCVDCRVLNNVTVKNRYPLPLIDDQLDKLTGKNYVKILNLAQRYH